MGLRKKKYGLQNVSDKDFGIYKEVEAQIALGFVETYLVENYYDELGDEGVDDMICMAANSSLMDEYGITGEDIENNIGHDIELYIAEKKKKEDE